MQTCLFCGTDGGYENRLGELQEKHKVDAREGGRRIPAELREELHTLELRHARRAQCVAHPHVPAEDVPETDEGDPDAAPTEAQIIAAARLLQRAEAAGVQVRLPASDEDDGEEAEDEAEPVKPKRSHARKPRAEAKAEEPAQPVQEPAQEPQADA